MPAPSEAAQVERPHNSFSKSDRARSLCATIGFFHNVKELSDIESAPIPRAREEQQLSDKRCRFVIHFADSRCRMEVRREMIEQGMLQYVGCPLIRLRRF